MTERREREARGPDGAGAQPACPPSPAPPFPSPAAHPPPQSPAGAPNLLLVLGMHRAGTSAAARATAALGFALGTDLLPPSPDNPSGYWEDREMVAINEALLASAGARWDTLTLRPAPVDPAPFRAAAAAWLDRRGVGRRPFAVKDPRLVRLLPFWQERIAESPAIVPAYLIVHRHPESVALSLAHRDGMPRLRALLLWQEHMLAALRHTEGAPRHLIDYDALIDAPDETLEGIAAGLGLPAPDWRARLAFRACFVDPARRHSRFGGAVGEGAPPGVGALAALLARAAREDPALRTPALRAEFAAIAAESERLLPLIAEIARLEAERDRLAAWIGGLEAHAGYRLARILYRLLFRPFRVSPLSGGKPAAGLLSRPLRAAGGGGGAHRGSGRT